MSHDELPARDTNTGNDQAIGDSNDVQEVDPTEDNIDTEYQPSVQAVTVIHEVTPTQQKQVSSAVGPEGEGPPTGAASPPVTTHATEQAPTVQSIHTSAGDASVTESAPAAADAHAPGDLPQPAAAHPTTAQPPAFRRHHQQKEPALCNIHHKGDSGTRPLPLSASKSHPRRPNSGTLDDGVGVTFHTSLHDENPSPSFQQRICEMCRACAKEGKFAPGNPSTATMLRGRDLVTLNVGEIKKFN
ncbi:hypothetical protein K438DRAFT_1748287 [Mycena galopus ATCC 62051]|nr:hypothetical protein K438DRAFT_1748287 [Mycena galopus ATCC 62051]